MKNISIGENIRVFKQSLLRTSYILLSICLGSCGKDPNLGHMMSQMDRTFMDSHDSDPNSKTDFSQNPETTFNVPNSSENDSENSQKKQTSTNPAGERTATNTTKNPLSIKVNVKQGDQLVPSFDNTLYLDPYSVYTFDAIIIIKNEDEELSYEGLKQSGRHISWKFYSVDPNNYKKSLGDSITSDIFEINGPCNVTLEVKLVQMEKGKRKNGHCEILAFKKFTIHFVTFNSDVHPDKNKGILERKNTFGWSTIFSLDNQKSKMRFRFGGPITGIRLYHHSDNGEYIKYAINFSDESIEKLLNKNKEAEIYLIFDPNSKLMMGKKNNNITFRESFQPNDVIIFYCINTNGKTESCAYMSTHPTT